ncbi:hypothetical protein GCM10023322_00340 [Rugosimonospora acidiphila]|uniref:Cytochrome P450 n=1 Tax=Rugosimonospora acidiphila TaxID=556531 RepID=A0ABP9RH82_9ACTN
MATRTPQPNRRHAASTSQVPIDMEDPYYRLPTDPYADLLLAQAGEAYADLRAQDDEFTGGWAA